MTRVVVIVNPLAGRGRHAREVAADAALAEDTLRAQGADPLVRVTTQSGDARQFAAEAVGERVDLVVVWGGDGTVNEVGSALVHTGIPMAIVPAGSGNGLAADAGIPFEPRAALRVALHGASRAIDAGQIDGSYFFNIAGVGVDAVIAAQFAARGFRRRGPLAYLQLTTAALWTYRAASYTFTLDHGVPFERAALLIAIANGRQYGNRLIIAPRARLDDGRLELVIVEPPTMWGIVRRLPALFRGTLRSGGGVTMRAIESLRLHAAGEILLHVDGEPRVVRDAVMVATHPGALLIRVPGVGGARHAHAGSAVRSIGPGD
ncbi:MAG: diacylglycerol/lipid kinase family protein [Acidobacteriota bacterium]